MVLAPNTSVPLRTLLEEDLTTAVTIKCVSLFDVDYSIQCALYYGLLEPRRGNIVTDRPTLNRSEQ